MISDISLFSDLSEAEYEIVTSHAKIRTYPKNTIILNEGDEAASLFFITSGKVRIFLSNEDGKEIILNELGPGEHFGELALIDDAPRSASVMTVRETKLALISKADFRRVLESHPGIAVNLITSLTRRFRMLSENVKSLALLDVYGRVAKILLDMSVEQDGNRIIPERPTQQEIANHIGASREMVARILKDLEIGGYITIERKTILIKENLPARY